MKLQGRMVGDSGIIGQAGRQQVRVHSVKTIPVPGDKMLVAIAPYGNG
ncbi:MAG: hypothetical protein V1791_13680 [Pseudomonadota bacterium]